MRIHAVLICSWLLFLAIGFCLSEDKTEGTPPPPTCIEVRGPATDKAEHLWSAHCMSNDYTPSHCIESACIAFRGLP